MGYNYHYSITVSNTVPLFSLLLLITNVPSAQSYTFGLVGKSRDDINFIDAWRGCDEVARAQGDECIFIAYKGEANVRNQVAAIKNALNNHSIDALAISVTDSIYLAMALAEIKQPADSNPKCIKV
ncbi:MAG: substrate-binding domain-containing protein [Spongiibacteraceae bacterium]